MRFHEIPDELRTKRKKSRDEEILQRSLVEYLRLVADKDCIWLHIPNGEARSKATGGRLKAMGLLAGAPDLMFLLPDASVCFLELKRPGGTSSAAQVAFAERCERIGVPVVTVSDIDTALRVLTAWGVVPPA